MSKENTTSSTVDDVAKNHADEVYATVAQDLVGKSSDNDFDPNGKAYRTLKCFIHEGISLRPVKIK